MKRRGPETVKHLWEIEHPYYCEAANWYSGDAYLSFQSWDSFVDAGWLALDNDLNHVFRWDWLEESEGDEDHARSCLFLGVMLQRKGKYVPIEIFNVTPDDEPAVRKFLESHWQTTLAMWAPIAAP